MSTGNGYAQDDKPKIEWSDLKIFTDEETGYAIRLQQGIVDGQRPRYSTSIGKVFEGKFRGFEQQRYVMQDGSLTVPEPYGALWSGKVLQVLGEECQRFLQEVYEKAREDNPRRGAPPREYQKRNVNRKNDDEDEGRGRRGWK